MQMIFNWIHIVIVHLTVIGTPWLAYRIFSHRKSPTDSKLWKDSYSGLIILAALSATAYFTGPETADWTKQVLAPYPQNQVEDHALWGRIAFVIQVIAGLLGIMGWSSILQEEKPASFLSPLLLVLLVSNTFIVFYTAHMGGLIRRLDLMMRL
jgi:uncharacterized membrane protein